MQQNNFAEGLLKGRMAETLVEEMLRKSGNTVYRFGYEAIMQNLIQLKRVFDADSDTGSKIRSIPDFIVLSDSGEPEFVEVKYRKNGLVHEDDIDRLKKISEFWKAKIIFVNSKEKPYFRISTPPFLDANGLIISRPLLEERNWKLDSKIMNEFEELVERHLKKEL